MSSARSCGAGEQEASRPTGRCADQTSCDSESSDLDDILRDLLQVPPGLFQCGEAHRASRGCNEGISRKIELRSTSKCLSGSASSSALFQCGSVSVVCMIRFKYHVLLLYLAYSKYYFYYYYTCAVPTVTAYSRMIAINTAGSSHSVIQISL